MKNQPICLSFQESHDIRIQLLNGEPWFCLVDICSVLELQTRSIGKFQLDMQGVEKLSTPTVGGNQELVFINEPNLYRVIFRSNKLEAKQFQNWIFNEVLPQIRKTGQYLPEKHHPQSPEVFNGNDLNNLARLVWEMSHGFRFDNSWRHGIWSALRQVTGIPSPKPFQTRHIPLIAEECVRIFHLTNRFKDVVADTEKQVIRRVIRQREDADNVISEMNALLEAAAHHTEHTLASTLEKWQQRELTQFLHRGQTT
ncbi:BRO-N domain-containing protein [Candidatus Williamhamiltonella defendens]|uniref:Antirepressor n=1 Tax=Candidatus Williamhamiltonella defendens TaxID=138072 RepID=A0A2D3TBE8_9ENTR|nr:BRO family protein [Candidatus Hamiltonella defensa]ATW33109.1 antirepressor [Candidatus Hamiltonella defensa]